MAYQNMQHFFIIGPPKTGTTLFTRLIIQHPDVSSISESYVLESRAESIANPESNKVQGHGFSKDNASRWHEILQSCPAHEALHTILTEAWDIMSQTKPAQAFGDSWPFYFKYLGSLQKAFPNARFFYTTRDPRAVYWSGETFMNRRQGPWNSQLLLNGDRASQPFLQQFKEQTHIVCYENLTQEPLNEMKKAWEHLGVDPERGYIDYDPDQDNWPQRWSFIPNSTKAIDPQRTNRWIQEMPNQIAQIVSLAAYDYCQRWNYSANPPTTNLTAEQVEAAFLCGAPLQMFQPQGEIILRNALYRARAHLMQRGEIPAII